MKTLIGCRDHDRHHGHHRLRSEREGDPRRLAVRRDRERARTQADRGSPRFPKGWPWASSGPSTEWRTCTSLPVFGAGALQASPRVGHLHVIVDDLPWWWADASDNNTVDIAGLPPGQHKVKIELVNANHEVFPGQSRTLTFTIPEGATLSHAH